jgi:phosphoglycolate phosphatase-like HAD superfamily hydrolase
MKRQIVIYKAKPEHNAENERLLKAVFAELRAKQPKDVRYVAARLSDDTYVHIVFTDTPEGEPNPLSKLDAFRAYQAEVRSRLQAPPTTGEATIIGDYRMLGE